MWRVYNGISIKCGRWDGPTKIMIILNRCIFIRDLQSEINLLLYYIFLDKPLNFKAQFTKQQNRYYTNSKGESFL